MSCLCEQVDTDSAICEQIQTEIQTIWEQVDIYSYAKPRDTNNIIFTSQNNNI